MPFEPRERSKNPSRDIGGYVTDTYSGKRTPFFVWTPYDLERLGYSQTHPYPYRSGGPFLVQKCELVVRETKVAREQWATQKWEGRHCPNPLPLQNTMLGLPSIPDTTMVNMGTKGWDKFKPAAHAMDAGQFLGELKDFKGMVTPKGLHSINPQQYLRDLKTSASQARNYGRSYLAREFGWRPFLNDLADFILSTHNFNQRLKQLKRDNGRNVRRSGTVKLTTSSNSTQQTGPGLFMPAVGPYWADNGRGTKTTKISFNQRFWFSGSFKYFISEIPEPPMDLSNLVRMYALKPTPKLVWELTPWSWLADYFGNIGSIMSNISGNAADSLVATYAFIMGTEETETEVSVDFKGKSGQTYSCSYNLIQSVKRRWPATPYGFGIDTTGFSAKQVAILAALGLSKT